MTINKENLLKIEATWADLDMFEAIIIVSNAGFNGIATTYISPSYLLGFVESLKSFPNRNNIEVFFESGAKDAHSYFSMRCYPIDYSGIIGVEVIIESDVATEYRPEEKSKLKTELIVEPHAIDVFRQQLKTLADSSTGSALLLGRYNSRLSE